MSEQADVRAAFMAGVQMGYIRGSRSQQIPVIVYEDAMFTAEVRWPDDKPETADEMVIESLRLDLAALKTRVQELEQDNIALQQMCDNLAEKAGRARRMVIKAHNRLGQWLRETAGEEAVG